MRGGSTGLLGANIAMAVAWALALKLTTFFGDEGEFLARMAIAGIFVNFALAALNLMPVPPLDGGRILTSLLPHRLALPFSRLEPYGMFILLALLASGLLGVVVAPLVDVGSTVPVCVAPACHCACDAQMRREPVESM